MTKRTCVCSLGQACAGVSSGFIICKDVRSGFVELPPTLADVEDQTVSVAMQIRKAYLRHLPLRPKEREALLVAKQSSHYTGHGEYDYHDDEKLYVALHHFDPSLVRAAILTPSKKPSHDVYTIPRTMSRAVMQHLEFKCTEKDRIYLEQERRYDNDEYIICPNYPLDKAKLHLQSLVRDQVKVNRAKKLEDDPKQDVRKELSTSTHSSCSSRRDGSVSNHSYTGSIGSSPRKKRYSSSYSASQRAAIMNQARLARSTANVTLSSAGDGNVKQHSVPGVVHVEAGGDYDRAAYDDDHYSDYNRTKDCSIDNKRTTLASPRRKSQRSLITKDSSSVVSSTSMPESHGSSRSRRGNGGSFLQELDRMMSPSPRQLQKKMPASSSNKVAMTMSSLPLSQNSDHGAAAVNEISEQINKLMDPRRKSKLVKKNKDSSQQQVSDVCAFTTDVCDANDNDESDSNNTDHDENKASDMISERMSPSPRQIKTRLTSPSDSKVAMTMASSSVPERNIAERDLAEQIKKLNSPRRKKRRSLNSGSTGSGVSKISTLKLLYNKDGSDEKDQNDATSRDNGKPKCSSEHLRSKKLPSSTSPRLASSCSSLDYDNDNEPNDDSTRKSVKKEVPTSPFLYLLEKLVEGGLGNNNLSATGIDRTEKGNKPTSPRKKKKMQLQQKPSSSREECLTTMPELVDYDIDEDHHPENMENCDIDCSQHSEPISPSKKSQQKRETHSSSGPIVSSRTTPVESPSNGSRSSRKKPFEKALSMSTLQYIPPATVVKSPVIVKKKDAATVPTPSDASTSISLVDGDVHEGRGKRNCKIFSNNDVHGSQYSESSLSKKKNKKFENSHSTSRLISSTPTESHSGPSERKKKRPSLSNKKSTMSTGETETAKIARSKTPSPTRTKKEKTSSTGLPALDLAPLSTPKSAESLSTSKTNMFSGQKKNSRKSSSSSTAVEEKKDASDDDDGAIVAKDKGRQTTTTAATTTSTTTALPVSIPLNHTGENSTGDAIVNEARQFLSELGVDDAAEFEELKIMNQNDRDDDGHCGVVSCSSSLVALSTDGQSKFNSDLPPPLVEDDSCVTEFAGVRYDSEDEDSALPKVRDLVPPPSGPPALPRVRDLESPSRHRPSDLLEINQVGDEEETPTTSIRLNNTLSTAFTDEMDSSTSMDGDLSGNDDHEALHPPSSMSVRVHESDDDDLGRCSIPSNHQTPSLYLGDSEAEESVSEFLNSFSSLGGLPLSSDMASSCHAMNVDMSEASENTDHQNHAGMNIDIFRSKQDNDASGDIGDMDNDKVADKNVVISQSLVRVWLSKRLVRRRIESIVCIQSTARRHLAERQVSVLHKIHQARVVHAATLIQSLARGIIAREQQSRMEYAATMIQSRVRGSLTRAHLAWMAYAASIIQGLVRGVIAREEVAIMIYAATKIEALVRGVIARKRHSPKVQSVACLPSSEMGFSAANEIVTDFYEDVDEQDNQSLDLDEAMLTDIHDNDASHDASHYFMYEEHEHQALRPSGGRQQLTSSVMDREPGNSRPVSEPTDDHFDHQASSSSLAFSTDGDHHVSSASLAFSTQSLDGERIIDSINAEEDTNSLSNGGGFLKSFLMRDKSDCASPLPLPKIEREAPRDDDYDDDEEELAQLNQLASAIAKERDNNDEEEDWDDVATSESSIEHEQEPFSESNFQDLLDDKDNKNTERKEPIDGKEPVVAASESSSKHEQEPLAESKLKDPDPEPLSDEKDDHNPESKEPTDVMDPVVDVSPEQNITVLASMEYKRRLWAVSELHTIQAQWGCHYKMLRTMSKETERVDALLSSTHRSLVMYARSLSAICSDSFLDKKGHVVTGFWQQSLLAVQRKHTAQTTAQVDVVDGYPAILHPFIDAFSSFAARLEEHLPFLGKCAEEVGKLSKAIDYRVKVLEEKYLDIMMDLKQAENKVAQKWDILEALNSDDSSCADIWLHEAEYRCAVSSKLTIWRQRCWELKRLLSDVVELEVHRRTKTRKLLLAFLTKRRLMLSKSREVLDPTVDELEAGRKPCDQIEAAIEESIQLLHVSKLHQQSRSPIFNRARYQLINGIDEVSIRTMTTHASTAPLYNESMLKNSLVYEVASVSFKLGREPEWRSGMVVITTFQHLHIFAVTKDIDLTLEDDNKDGDIYSSKSTAKNNRDEEMSIHNDSHGDLNISNSSRGTISSQSQDTIGINRNNCMRRSGSVSSLVTKGLRHSFKRGGSVSSLPNSPRGSSNNTSNSNSRGLSESCPWSEFNSKAVSPPLTLCSFDAHHEEALTHKPKACVWLSTCAFGLSADGGHVELIPNFDDQAIKVYLRFDDDDDDVGDIAASPASQSRAATWLRNTQQWAFLAASQQ